MTQRPIVLAAGGTGGHIFPAESVLEELQRRGAYVKMISDKRYFNYLHQQSRDTSALHIIYADHLSHGLLKKLRAAFKITLGIMQAIFLLKKINPSVVVGFGGYPAFPTLFAARLLGYPIILHEQNSIVGKANANFADAASIIATSFNETTGITSTNYHKVVVTGNPVRPAIQAVRTVSYPELTDEGMLNILVIGGSQGASVFSSVIPAALSLLSPKYQKRIHIEQQCRPDDLERTQLAYRSIAVEVELATFFTNMSERLQKAHLIISRSGASSLAELTVAGRPALLVPLPHAANDHQTVNARFLVEHQAAWLMPQSTFSKEALAGKIENFFKNPTALQKAASQAYKLGTPQAASTLATLIEQFVNK